MIVSFENPNPKLFDESPAIDKVIPAPIVSVAEPIVNGSVPILLVVKTTCPVPPSVPLSKNSRPDPGSDSVIPPSVNPSMICNDALVRVGADASVTPLNVGAVLLMISCAPPLAVNVPPSSFALDVMFHDPVLASSVSPP